MQDGLKATSSLAKETTVIQIQLSSSKGMLLEYFTLFKIYTKTKTNETQSWLNYGFGGNERVNGTV